MTQEQFYQWFEEIKKHFSKLKKWQALGLALISYGIIKARRSQASLISEELPEFGKASTVERRIQRWLANPRIQIAEIRSDWISWILGRYQDKFVYLLVDETKISNRIGCMMVSIAIQKRAIPLVWRCYRANSAVDYPEEGQVKMIGGLLKDVLAVMPENKQIIVEADRGIGNSSNLMREVSEIGVDFLFRVKWSSIFTAKDGRSTSLRQLARRGEEWHGNGTLFTKDHKVDCDVHILWDQAQDEPWCLATSLQESTGHTYRFRAWQEESFRDLKSGGWQWQSSLIRNPETVERLLFPMVIAYAWCISIGLLFSSLDDDIRSVVDCIRQHPKYCVFRIGLRYFKRYLFLDASKIPLQLGPFHTPF